MITAVSAPLLVPPNFVLNARSAPLNTCEAVRTFMPFSISSSGYSSPRQITAGGNYLNT